MSHPALERAATLLMQRDDQPVLRTSIFRHGVCIRGLISQCAQLEELIDADSDLHGFIAIAAEICEAWLATLPPWVVVIANDRDATEAAAVSRRMDWGVR